jgi:F-type H+-transporting ATPase subunit b
MLNPNPGLILWTIITFILLVIVLRLFAWKPLLEALKKREDTVRDSLKKAEEARADAERLIEENRRQLARAEQEGKRILNESRTLAQQLQKDLTEKAQEQSRKMIEQARAEICRDKDAALKQLRGEVASLALGAAEKILNETLDEAKHRRIIDTYLKDLPAN